MKRVKQILGIMAVAALITSCTMVTPLSVSSAPIGDKNGVSKTGVLFGVIYLNKEYGIAEAARNAKIKAGVATVDESVTKIPVVSLFFYEKQIMVTGN